MTRVGILGGGQLGRMLALAGYPLGMTFRILDPAVDACAGQIVADHVVAAFDDEAALRRFAEGLDCVTYEWENVPVETVRFLSQYVRVDPPVEALEVAQDRLLEKHLFRKLGIATAPFAPVDLRSDLDAAIEVTGLPAILKTRRLGYDGKGQQRLEARADMGAAWQALEGRPLVLEGFVPFTRELSIIAVATKRQLVTIAAPRRRMYARPPTNRSVRLDTMLKEQAEVRMGSVRRYGEMGLEVEGHRSSARAYYALVENIHHDGILRISRAPAGLAAPRLQAQAEDIAERIIDATGYAGVLAIELFEHEGRLLANEMAPRVHNSGHWTIEGAETSQFENHLRAIVGLPLGSTEPRGHSAMVNLVGAIPDAADVARIEGAHLHLYGKAPRPGRKVGHVTVRGDSASSIEASLSQVASLIESERG